MNNMPTGHVKVTLAAPTVPVTLQGPSGNFVDVGANKEAFVGILGPDGRRVVVTPDGKLSVDAQVTALIADSKIKASPDGGESWVPVKADTAGNLGVTLNGSLVEETVLTTTPLAAGGNWTQPTQTNDGSSVALSVQADTLVDVRLYVSDGVSISSCILRVTLDPTAGIQYIPPIPLSTPRWYWRVENPTATAQASLRVVQTKFKANFRGLPQTVRCVLAKDLAIRDTSGHSPYTGDADRQYCFPAALAACGESALPIFVKNGLDQSVNVEIRYAAAPTIGGSIGTFTVPAGQSVVKTNQDYPALGVPQRTLYLYFICATAPTSGTIEASMLTSMG